MLISKYLDIKIICAIIHNVVVKGVFEQCIGGSTLPINALRVYFGNDVGLSQLHPIYRLSLIP